MNSWGGFTPGEHGTRLASFKQESFCGERTESHVMLGRAGEGGNTVGQKQRVSLRTARHGGEVIQIAI
jgi:hypothetical protein